MRIKESSINLRSHIKEIIEESDGVLDFENVEFISRAVADEIYHQSVESEELVIKNLNTDIAKMLDTIGELDKLDFCE